VLNNYRNNIGIETFRKFLMISKLPLTQKNLILITFPYFLEKYAPVSKLPSLMDYECSFMAHHLKKIKILSSVSKSL